MTSTITNLHGFLLPVNTPSLYLQGFDTKKSPKKIRHLSLMYKYKEIRPKITPFLTPKNHSFHPLTKPLSDPISDQVVKGRSLRSLLTSALDYLPRNWLLVGCGERVKSAGTIQPRKGGLGGISPKKATRTPKAIAKGLLVCACPNRSKSERKKSTKCELTKTFSKSCFARFFKFSVRQGQALCKPKKTALMSGFCQCIFCTGLVRYSLNFGL